MTLCIHCTRCTRFGSEIVGLEVLGTLNCGSGMEIGLYLPKLFSSEISGNAIDLCPVTRITNHQITKLNTSKKKFKKKEEEEIDWDTEYKLNYELQRARENDPVEQQRRYKRQCEDQLKMEKSSAYRAKQTQ